METKAAIDDADIRNMELHLQKQLFEQVGRNYSSGDGYLFNCRFMIVSRSWVSVLVLYRCWAEIGKMGEKKQKLSFSMFSGGPQGSFSHVWFHYLITH